MKPFEEYIYLQYVLSDLRRCGADREILEDAFADVLENLWWQLTDEEQAKVESK